MENKEHIENQLESIKYKINDLESQLEQKNYENDYLLEEINDINSNLEDLKNKKIDLEE